MRGGVAYYFVLFPLKTLEFNFGIKTLKGGGFISQKYKNIALTIHQDFKIKLNVFFSGITAGNHLPQIYS